jgi:hypothetical protein
MSRMNLHTSLVQTQKQNDQIQIKIAETKTQIEYDKWRLSQQMKALRQLEQDNDCIR